MKYVKTYKKMKKIKTYKFIGIKIIDINNKKVYNLSTKELVDLYCKKRNIPTHIIYNKLITNKFNVLEFIFKSLYENYEIIDLQSRGLIDPGHPDFIIKINEKQIYVELKTPNDSIRISQIEWILKNPDKHSIILCLLEGGYQHGISKREIKELEKQKQIKKEVSNILEKDKFWKEIFPTLKFN